MGKGVQMLESCDIGLKSSLRLDGGVGPRKQKIDLVKSGRMNEAGRNWNFGAEISFHSRANPGRRLAT
jgi:hypothetical protein